MAHIITDGATIIDQPADISGGDGIITDGATIIGQPADTIADRFPAQGIGSQPIADIEATSPERGPIDPNGIGGNNSPRGTDQAAAPEGYQADFAPTAD